MLIQRGEILTFPETLISLLKGVIAYPYKSHDVRNEELDQLSGRWGLCVKSRLNKCGNASPPIAISFGGLLPVSELYPLVCRFIPLGAKCERWGTNTMHVTKCRAARARARASPPSKAVRLTTK